MNVEHLASVSAETSRRWMCGSCNSIWTDISTARNCCQYTACRLCLKSTAADKTFCTPCKIALDEQYKQATKIAYVDYEVDYFFWPGAEGGGRFFRTRTELEKYCLDHKLEYPQWAWACRSEALRLNAREILNSSYEGAEYYIEDSEFRELQQLLDTWASRQPLRTFAIDYTTAVVIDYALLQRERKSSELDEALAEV